MSTVHVVLPGRVDDPSRPSGGNVYDRRVCDGLTELGWAVHELPVAGEWPHPDRAARERLARVLSGVPDGATVLLDGLVASGVPEVIRPEAARVRLVVLVHLPLGVGQVGPTGDGTLAGARPRERSAERAVLEAVRAVVVTSRWARDWLRSTYDLERHRVSVVTPGAEPADRSRHSPSGGRLACVGAVTPTKGQDVLVYALAAIGDLGWSCTCVGSTAVDRAFADRVRRSADSPRVADRLRFTGPLPGDGLAEVYHRTDLLVVPSRTETFGIVVAEALARGIPVVGADVGGLPEALGRTPDGRRPGILVPPDDPAALSRVLRRWLTDDVLRARLRRAAADRRAGVRGWTATAASLADVLAEVAA